MHILHVEFGTMFIIYRYSSNDALKVKTWVAFFLSAEFFLFLPSYIILLLYSMQFFYYPVHPKYTLAFVIFKREEETERMEKSVFIMW